MSKPERRDDSLFLAARTGDLGGVDVIFSCYFRQGNRSTHEMSVIRCRQSSCTLLAWYYYCKTLHQIVVG